MILAALAQTPALVAADTVLDGMYMAKGLNPDGTDYQGLVQIVRHGDSFFVTWISYEVSADTILLTPIWMGVGIVTNGMLAVSYHGADRSGVVVYRIESDGQRLDGRWAVAGKDGTVYPETLTKLPDGGLDPPLIEPPAEEHSVPKRKVPVRGIGTLAL
jgi:hypothetical protein